MGSKLLWPAALNLKELSWGSNYAMSKAVSGDRSRVDQLPGDPQGLSFAGWGW